MSRHEKQVLTDHLLVVGWDPPLQTFFGQMYPPGEPEHETGKAAVECVGCKARTVITIPDDDSREVPCPHCGKRLASYSDDGEGGPTVWVGAGQRLPTVEDLADALGPPWKRLLLDDEALCEQLVMDKEG